MPAEISAYQRLGQLRNAEQTRAAQVRRLLAHLVYQCRVITDAYQAAAYRLTGQPPWRSERRKIMLINGTLDEQGFTVAPYLPSL